MLAQAEAFSGFAVPDIAAAQKFYGETLGLEQTGKVGFPEFKLGDNGFLYLLKLEEIGSAFRAPHEVVSRAGAVPPGLRAA